LNFKLLIGLLVATAILGAGIYLVHGFQDQRLAAALLKQAERAEQKGDLEKREKYLSRYLAYRPDDADALAKYVLLLDKRDTAGKDRLRVLLALEESLRRAPDPDDALHREVRRRAADLDLTPGLGRYREARAHLEILLKAAPDDAELELRLGRCLEMEAQTGKSSESEAQYRRARAWYKKAVAHDPGGIEAPVRLAELLRGAFHDPGEADRTMDRMVAGDTKSPRPAQQQAQAHLARARYRKAARLAGADEDVERARQLDSDDADVLVAAADSAREKGDPDRERKLLERGVELHPKDARMYEALARHQARVGRPDEAEKVLNQGLKALPEETLLQWSLADLLIQTGKKDEAGNLEADKVLNLLRKQENVFQPSVDFLEARLLVKKGQRAEGVELLEHARALMASVRSLADLTKQADLLLAENYEELGNPERQLAASRRVLDRDPLSIPARLGQANALLTLGHTDSALEAYRALARQVPAMHLRVAQLLIARNVALPEDKRRWSEVDQAVDEAARASSDSLAVTLLRADALTGRGQLDAARDLIQEARDKQPDQVAPWIALANLAGRQGKPEAILSVLDEARRRLGDRVELRLARASYWGQRGGKEAHKALDELARESETLSVEDRLRLERILADSFARIGDIPRAEKLWTRVFDQRPDDLRTATFLFDLTYLAGDQADSNWLKESVDRLRRTEGEDGALWRYGEALRLVVLAGKGGVNVKQQLDEARVLLAEVAKRRPEWSRVPRLESMIAELQGDKRRAADASLRAIERGDRNPSVVRRAVDLLRALGRSTEADRAVQKMLEEAPPSGPLGQLAAEMALRHNDPQQSLELATRAVSRDSNDYRNQLWLGSIYVAAGRLVEAGEAFRRAVTLAGDSPETWGPYIAYLARTTPKDRPPALEKNTAEEAIEEAKRQIPPERAPLMLAACYTIIGKPEQAEQQFKAALAAKPDDVPLLQTIASFYVRLGQTSKAEPYVEKILNPQAKASEAQLTWTRRQKAVALAMQGSYPKIREALALVERNLQAQSDSVDDQRLKAVLLGMQPGSQRDAIHVLEELARQSPPTTGERFLEARLYEVGGNWPKARELLRSALASDEENAGYLVEFIRGLLTHGEASEAGPWLDKLEKLYPQSAQSVELRARLLAAQGKKDEVVTLLQSYSKDKDNLLGATAGLLRELGQLDAAEAMYREDVARSTQPEAILVLAAFVAERNRLSEALDLCDQAWQTCNPERVGQTSLAVLVKAKADDTHFQRVESRLEEAMRKQPRSISLRFNLATLQTLRGQYAEAEALYRRICEEDTSKDGPRNNLAWLLAVAEGKGEEALSEIAQAIDVAGPRPSLLDTRALAYMATGRSDLAIKDLEAATAVARPSPEMYLHLAQARLMAKDRKGADVALQKAKVSGLNTESLHPLERKAYERLLGDLKPP
jgi:tetratricopeptide (TPR) repeat protein